MTHRVLRAATALWRPSNAMKVENTDLARQLDARSLSARFWRLQPGQASTWHRDPHEELYVLLEGTGRVRVEEHTHTLDRYDTLLVSPAATRQIFNDTKKDALWLIVGGPSGDPDAPSEWSYPEGKTALPPELGGGRFEG